MSSLERLLEQGQSVWLDYVDRPLIQSGGLLDLVRAGVRGVTTNPSIFHKAITGSDHYDEALRALLAADPQVDAETLCHALTVEDVQMAADVLRPLYEESAGGDGFVSIEVSPHLAFDTAATIEAAQLLWRDVDRPNVMIKVPGTLAGLPAVEQLIAVGINVNVTLLFSVARYEQVIDAFLRGLDACAAPQKLASVASFFVSRVDGKVDARLQEIGTDVALALRGRIAIGNAKLAYRRFRARFGGEGFARYRERGASVQRALWGSTSTKDPTYSDVLYIEHLIGPQTVNTVPPETLDAFRDHGEVRASLEEGVPAVEQDMLALAEIGIELEAITAQLEREGVKAFQDSYDALLAALEKKREALAAVAAT